MNTSLSKKMKKNRRGDSTPASLLGSVLQGVGIGAAASMLLSLIFCAYAISRPDPASLIAICGYGSLFLGALTSGLASSKLSHRSGILPALLSGTILLGASLMLHIFLGGADRSIFVQLLMFAAIPLTSILGGILGSIRLAPRRKHKFR